MVWSVAAFAQTEAQLVDAGEAPPAEPLDAGVAQVTVALPTSGFDTVTTPWGPGRKSSGERFHSTAEAVSDGPLRWNWNGFSLAIGAQYFGRGELRDNADLTTSHRDFSLGLDQRARLSVRASAKERVGLLLELQDVRAWGSEPNTVTVTPNTGLHQGFLDVRAAKWLDVRIGRQELSYGEDRLIGNLDWAQTARAFDGVFLRVTASPHVTIDGFAMMLKPPSWLTPDAQPRFMNSGSYFSGLYLRARFGRAGFDTYALGLFEDVSTVAGWLPHSNRATLGARAFFNVQSLAVVGEGAFQTGLVGPARELELAGAFALKATYTLSSVWGTPYVLGEVSGASGDGTPGDGVDHTFNQLFPTGHAHLGYMDYVGWSNVVAAHGAIGFRPWGANVWLDVHHFRAWDPRGAWVAANGSVFVPADVSRTNGNMGTELDLSVTVPLFDFVSLAGNVSVFFPGGAGAARGTNPSTWGFLSLRSQL